jgi:hypothetical protein
MVISAGWSVLLQTVLAFPAESKSPEKKNAPAKPGRPLVEIRDTGKLEPTVLP